MRIVFMGTPEFAVPSLQVLVENGMNIVGVITAPDKPKGRGKKFQSSAIKEYALSQNLKILQPTNLKSEDFIQELSELQADLQIVVAFRMLPEVVWSMPPKGTFNLHGSLLPQYRGAAPINWAIINGEKETGVTTFFLKHEIDTGNIAFQEKETILPEDNVGTLYGRLMHKGANLVLKTVRAIESNGIELKEQNEEQTLNSAPKIHKDTCKIDWTKSSTEILNFVRGLSPYPTAWTILKDKKYKVFEVGKSKKELKELKIGGFLISEHNEVFVKTGDGTISLQEIQPEGKKRMKTGDFLRGNTF